MVACSWHDALVADQLPPQIVGVWCLTSEGMLLETYMAARGARAASRARAARWHSHERHRRRAGSANLCRGVPAGHAGVRLERRAQSSLRSELGGGAARNRYDL